MPLSLAGQSPSPDHSRLAYDVRDNTVSAGGYSGGSTQVVSEGSLMLNGDLLSEFERSQGESSEFMSCSPEQNQLEEQNHLPEQNHPSEQNRSPEQNLAVPCHLDPSEGHISVTLPESRYMYHLAFDEGLSLDLDRDYSKAEVDGVKSQSKLASVTGKDAGPGTADVSVAEAIRTIEEDCICVEAEEIDVDASHNGSATSGGCSQMEILPAECATVVCRIPTAVDSNDDQLIVSGTDVSEPFDTDDTAAEPQTAITVDMPVTDIGRLECEQSHMDTNENMSDCGWDGSPSEVGGEDNARDRGPSGVSRIVPVSAVQPASTSRNVDVVNVSASEEVDIINREPGEGDDYCQSTAVLSSGEDLLVMVNFRITADRYEGSSMASETRESFSRMVVRPSDVLPRLNWTCCTLSDQADQCCTENRQFYLIQKRKTNVVLGGESFLTTAADDGRSSDFRQTDWYGADVSDRVRQIADRSVTKTTTIVKRVVTTTEIDNDAAERRLQNVDDTSTRDTDVVAEDDDRSSSEWIMETVRRRRLETGDTIDSSCTMETGESETTGYMSVSENYTHEDVDGSFLSCLEDLETITDTSVTDMSDEDTGTDLDKTALEVGDSEVRDVTQSIICVEFPDNDNESKRSEDVEIMESDEAAAYHTPDVHFSVEVQETEMWEVGDAEPVNILTVLPLSPDYAYENTAVKTGVVESHAQVITADSRLISEDETLSGISSIDTLVIRPVAVNDVTTSDVVVTASTSISVMEGQDVNISVTVDDGGTASGSEIDSAMIEHVDPSKDLIIPEIEKTGEVMFENVSDIGEIDVESLTLINHKSELCDTVLRSCRTEAFVEPVTQSGISYDECTTVSSLSEVEARAVSTDVMTVDTAVWSEQSVEQHADAVSDASADAVSSDVDVTERCSLHPVTVKDDACGNALNEQVKTHVGLQLSHVTDYDLLCQTDEDESCAVAAAGSVVSYVVDSAVKSEGVASHVESITVEEDKYMEQTDWSAGTDIAVTQDRTETWVQATVTADVADVNAQQSFTKLDDVRTCTVTASVMTDVAETVAVADKCVGFVTEQKADEQDVHVESKVTDELPDGETCLGLVLHDEGDDRDAFREFTQPVTSLVSPSIVTDTADVKSLRTESCVEAELGDPCDEFTEVTALTELDTFDLGRHHDVDDEHISDTVVMERVNSQVEGVEGDIVTCHNAVDSLKDVKTCNLDIINNRECRFDVVSAENINNIETFVEETTIDYVPEPESVSTLDVDKPEVYISGVPSVSEAGHAVFVNTVRFQTDRQLVDPHVSAAQTTEAELRDMGSDGGCDFDSLQMVKTRDIWFDDYSERVVDQNGSSSQMQSAACQTNGDMPIQQKSSTVSVGLQTVCSEAGTAQSADEDPSKVSSGSQMSCEYVVKSTQTDEHNIVITVDRMSSAVQTDHVHSVGLSTDEPQMGSCETSSEPGNSAETIIAPDVHSLRTAVEAVVETQTLFVNDKLSVTEVQTSPVDLASIDTETIEQIAGTVTTEAETCTTPTELSVVATQTLPYKDTEEGQTNTTPVHLASIDTQTIEQTAGTVTTEAETCTTPTELSVVETQTLPYKDTEEGQTNTTPVDLVSIDTQTTEREADTVMVDEEICTTAVDVAVVETQTLPDQEPVSTAEAQTCVTPVDLVMVDMQTVWTDDDDNFSHSTDSALVHIPQISQLFTHDNMWHETEDLSTTDNFTDAVLQGINELEATDSSSESIYLEDYSSSSETLFTDALEDIEDILDQGCSSKSVSDDTDNFLEDQNSKLSESEYTDALMSLQEHDSCPDQTSGDAVDHGVPLVDLFDPRDSPTLHPPKPLLVSMEQWPVGSDVVTNQNQVSCRWWWLWHYGSLHACQHPCGLEHVHCLDVLMYFYHILCLLFHLLVVMPA